MLRFQMMDVKKLRDYWLKSAETDFVLADKLFYMKEYPYALFFCHLALEKTLKAIFVEKKKTHAPYSHSLLYLSEKIGIPLTSKKKDFLDEMTKFNIEGRYPEELVEIHKKFTLGYSKPYFSKTQEFLLWLRKMLSR